MQRVRRSLMTASDKAEICDRWKRGQSLSEFGEHFASCGEAKRELCDYREVFCNQRRRHPTRGRISPTVSERRAQEVQAA